MTRLRRTIRSLAGGAALLLLATRAEATINFNVDSPDDIPAGGVAGRPTSSRDSPARRS